MGRRKGSKNKRPFKSWYLNIDKKKWLEAMKKGIKENSPNYKGGKITSQGYVKILVGKYKNGHSKYELEHRLVMEGILGRRLNNGEIVHHINEVTTDNRPENLMLFPNVAAHRNYHRELCRNVKS